MAGLGLPLILVLGLGVRCYGFTAPLLDSHHQRQTQTALIARKFYRDGIDLLHPRLPLSGASEEVVRLDFPLYQAAAALISRGVGFFDATGRALSIVGSLCALVLVWRIALALGASPGGALVAALVMAVSPLWVYFGRAYMVDSWAHTLALGAIYGGLRYREARVPISRASWIMATCVMLAAALLVKATTVYVIVPIVYLLCLVRRSQAVPLGLGVGLAVLSAVPVLLWVGGGSLDIDREYSIPWLLYRTVSAGVPSLIDPNRWGRVLVSGVGLTVTPGVFGVALWATYAARHSEPGRLVAVWLAALLAELLVLFPAASTHDYYQLGWAPPLAIGVGLVPSWVTARVWREERRKWYLVAAGILLIVHLYAGYRFFSYMYDPGRRIPYHAVGAAKVAELTSPSDVLALDDPPNASLSTFAYYSDRRLIAIDTGRGDARDELTRAIEKRGVSVLVAIDSAYGSGTENLRRNRDLLGWLDKHARMLLDSPHLMIIRVRELPDVPGASEGGT